MSETTMKRTLPCKLTDPEVLTKSAELAQLMVKVADQEEELRLWAASEREEIKGQKKRAGELARAVASRTETREVDCYEYPDAAAGLVLVIRRDTGERVDSRPMEAKDRQLELVPGAKVLPHAHSRERSTAPAHERTSERLSAPPTCACDHAPAEHACNEGQDGWGPCTMPGCECDGSGAPSATTTDDELAF